MRKVIGKVTLIIYGSYARGDFNLWSDVDVILISEYFTNIDFLKRYDIISKFIPENFEVKIWTLQEAKRNLSKPWWKEALRNRIVIVDDYGLFT
ncbi:MAG TPA: nucleotidyltransferase domain-containing protein [Acidilobales archaeon]|nr:MAG: DNA polymerase III subunit beta [Desulfurococcales archaeon ex4484_42]RLG83060.1 MAG: nucleotidyltransferase domain-containing protein [Thermoprotei archaeon]HDD26211.1 nucleotidyltransferase domain-containing protein [Acidilobales archaeon]